MKESLRLLNVNSSGLTFSREPKKNDDEIYAEASNIAHLADKVTYLKGLLNEKVLGYPKSKRYLVSLVKQEDPKLAHDLIISECQYQPVNPDNYLLFAELAVEHNAWKVVISALEASKWLCSDKHHETLKKINELFELVTKKILSGEKDNTKTEFWRNKFVDKYWILERLYYKLGVVGLLDYLFKLLNVFPDDLQNNEVLYMALSLVNDKVALNKFLIHLKEDVGFSNQSKNLYLGIIYYGLDEFDVSISHLRKVDENNIKNTNLYFYLALNYLIKGDLAGFKSVFNKVLPPPRPSFTALYFIFCALTNFKLDEIEFPDQKKISSEVVKILDKLIKNNQSELVEHLMKQFNSLNFNIILPFLNLYLAELFIKENQLTKAKKVLKLSSENEVHRLLAWIYRLESKDDLAEQELIEYRKNLMSGIKAGLICQQISLDLPSNIPDDTQEIFNLLLKAYEKTEKLVQQFNLEYGLNEMTCKETGCLDCCTKTFPYITYVEYLYLKNWLDTQEEGLRKQIYERSVQIVNLYKTKYKKAPPFLFGKDIDPQKEYPPDFVFECPNLGNNKCNVYEARPFTCRAYAFASADGVKYKGCNYFFEQLKNANMLTPVRKVISMESFFNFAKLVDEKLIGKRVIAPIPVWFAQSHEETMKKVLLSLQ